MFTFQRDGDHVLEKEFQGHKAGKRLIYIFESLTYFKDTEEELSITFFPPKVNALKKGRRETYPLLSLIINKWKDLLCLAYICPYNRHQNLRLNSYQISKISRPDSPCHGNRTQEISCH